jgi:hypothetical protein
MPQDCSDKGTMVVHEIQLQVVKTSGVASGNAHTIFASFTYKMLANIALDYWVLFAINICGLPVL